VANDYNSTKQENNKIIKLLKGNYLAEYKKLRKMLKSDIESPEELEDVLGGILLLLYDAQSEGNPAESIYGNDFENFYNDILQALPNSFTVEKKQNRNTTKNIAIVILSCVVLALTIFFVLWQNGTIGVYQRGMAFLMENSAYTIDYKDLDLVIETEIDLYNLDSNTGKVIYDDGQCKIEIALVRKELDGSYNAFFRTHGSYNRLGGTLISPTKQRMTEQHYATYDVGGKLQVIVDDVAYDSYNSATSSLNLKDGDEFGFYIFPLECYENGKFLVEDSIKNQGGKVSIRLFNLSKITWNRKDI